MWAGKDPLRHPLIGRTFSDNFRYDGGQDFEFFVVNVALLYVALFIFSLCNIPQQRRMVSESQQKYVLVCLLRLYYVLAENIVCYYLLTILTR